MGYNFFNWTTRNMHQKFSYFPRPSFRATPIHSRHLYFPPVSTFGLPEHDFLYSLKVQCILNLAKYFFSIASYFLLLFIASVPVSWHANSYFLFSMKIGSTNKKELWMRPYHGKIAKFCVKSRGIGKYLCSLYLRMKWCKRLHKGSS